MLGKLDWANVPPSRLPPTPVSRRKPLPGESMGPGPHPGIGVCETLVDAVRQATLEPPGAVGSTISLRGTDAPVNGSFRNENKANAGAVIMPQRTTAATPATGDPIAPIRT